MIRIGELSLRRAVDQFVDHYHRHRNHQGLENKLIEPKFGSTEEGEVSCHERLGELLRYYFAGCRVKPTISVSGHCGIT
jgi:hypothetical protein